jgi:hypothetical protein
LLAPVVPLNDEDRRRLDAGRAVVKVVEGTERSHLVVFAASRIAVTPQRFVEAIRNTPRLWRGPKVPRTGTFGVPARAQDVESMRLSTEDLRALRHCRAGDCDVKLSPREMARVQAVINTASADDAPVQHEFQQIVLNRIAQYRQGGLSALDTLHDQAQTVDLQATFSGLITHAQAMTRLAPELIEYFQRYPRLPLPAGCEEFFYWLETVDTPKPTIQAWHVTIRTRPRGDGVEVIALSRQIFATHYINGVVSMTALLANQTSGPRLLYLNRISADGLGGFLSGIRRFFIERRVRSGARAAFDWMRHRIEDYR